MTDLEEIKLTESVLTDLFNKTISIQEASRLLDIKIDLKKPAKDILHILKLNILKIKNIATYKNIGNLSTKINDEYQTINAIIDEYIGFNKKVRLDYDAVEIAVKNKSDNFDYYCTINLNPTKLQNILEEYILKYSLNTNENIGIDLENDIIQKVSEDIVDAGYKEAALLNKPNGIFYEKKSYSINNPLNEVLIDAKDISDIYIENLYNFINLLDTNFVYLNMIEKVTDSMIARYKDHEFITRLINLSLKKIIEFQTNIINFNFIGYCLYEESLEKLSHNIKKITNGLKK